MGLRKELSKVSFPTIVRNRVPELRGRHENGALQKYPEGRGAPASRR